MNLKKRPYLDQKGTSAWSTSKQRFTLNLNDTNLVVRIRVAVSTRKGFHPQLFLLRYLSKRGSYEYEKFSLLDYKDGYLRARFHKIYSVNNNLTYIHPIKGIENLDLAQFNEYDFEFSRGVYKVRINGQVYFEKELRPGLDYHEKLPYAVWNELAQYMIIITVMADLDKVDKNEDDCFSLLLDYIRVYRNFSFDYDELDNFTKISPLTSNEFCELPEKINAYDKFVPRASLNLMWQDEFDGDKLDATKWNIIVQNDSCSSVAWIKSKFGKYVGSFILYKMNNENFFTQIISTSNAGKKVATLLKTLK